MKTTNEFELISKLIESYKSSSRNNNQFERFIKSTKWEQTYKTEDETMVFQKADITLEVMSLNPFDSVKPLLMVGTEMIYL
jgi:hypothetical protein